MLKVVLINIYRLIFKSYLSPILQNYTDFSRFTNTKSAQAIKKTFIAGLKPPDKSSLSTAFAKPFFAD